MTAELPAVRDLRLKLKAAKALIRDLSIAVARADEALEQALHAQPDERAQHEHRAIRAA